MNLDTSFETQKYVDSRRGTVLPPSSPQELIYTGAGSVSELGSKRWGTVSFGRRRAQSSKTWGSVFLSVTLAVLLMLSLCHHPFGVSSPGIRLRQLGESESEEDDDLPMPSSPDLTEICYALGEWIPEPPSAGGPRASPDLVQAVLATLEAEVESKTGAATGPSALVTFDSDLEGSLSGTVLKRSLSREASDKAGSPGPSWKMARTYGLPAVEQTPPSQSMSAGGEPKETGQRLPVPPSTFPAFVGPRNAVIPAAQQLTTSSSTAPALDEGASTSSETTGLAATWVPQDDPLRKHPFVRLPALQPGVKPLQFSPSLMKDIKYAPRELSMILGAMRELFLKAELDLANTYSLVCKAQDLARHAYARMTLDISQFRPSRAADYLGRRFIMFWYLYSASKVVDQGWASEPWWGELVERIPSHYSPSRGRRSYDLEWSYRLIRDLTEAIDQLKSGNPLPEAVVVDLKRRIFRLPTAPGRFKFSSWDPWRSDDRYSSN